MADMDLEQLKAAIAQLERDGIQKQFDEGARLHNEKNAPTVNGTYTHLKFPAYQFREFPKMLYGPDFLAACAEYDRAFAYRERRDEQGLRNSLIVEAQTRKDKATKIVNSRDEQDTVGGLWCETPDLALAAEKRNQDQIALAAAEAAFLDRNLGDVAKRERQAADDASEGHLVEVPEQKRGPGRPRRDP